MTERLAPGAELLRQVRAGFVLKGTTLGGWCRENGIPRANARDTLMGSWDGPKGRALRTRLLEASGVAQPAKRGKAAA